MSADRRCCYLLLMRHVGPSTEDRAGLDTVSQRLRETISELERLTDHTIRLATIVHGDSPPATETAQVVSSKLAGVAGYTGQLRPHSSFNGRHASPYSGGNFDEEKAEAWKLIATKLDLALSAGGNAILVVGHQPLIGIIADSCVRVRLAGRQWRRRSVPLTHSEVACLADVRGLHGFHSWRLMWTVAPSNETVMEQLREKIVAKMTVASIIGSVAGATLVLLLDSLFNETPTAVSTSISLRYGAAMCLFLATWLYLATVYFCDRLLMPVRFWREPDRPADLRRRPRWLVWRPPGSAAWIVYQNMLHLWRWFFIPATILAALGILLLGGAVLRPTTLCKAIVVLLPIATSLAALMGYCFWRRPRLGVED